VLQGLNLGRFRIELNLQSLGRRTNKNVYVVRSLDLKGAATNGSVRHPHVLFDHLNAREFAEPIREAKLAGRIADLFDLVVKALRTYDPTTAYIKIEDWQKVFCSQCHRELPEGLHTFCDSCQEWCCEKCRLECPACGEKVCEDCQGVCHTCAQVFCAACMTRCAMCGAKSCQKCLQTGLCPTCAKEWAKEA
jgi:hypothetical protein